MFLVKFFTDQVLSEASPCPATKTRSDRAHERWYRGMGRNVGMPAKSKPMAWGGGLARSSVRQLFGHKNQDGRERL